MGRFPEYVRAQVPQTNFLLIRLEDVLEHGHIPETKCRCVAEENLLRKFSMERVTGIEPANVSLGSLCLTTWRHPLVSAHYSTTI